MINMKARPVVAGERQQQVALATREGGRVWAIGERGAADRRDALLDEQPDKPQAPAAPPQARVVERAGLGARAVRLLNVRGAATGADSGVRAAREPADAGRPWRRVGGHAGRTLRLRRYLSVSSADGM